MELNTASQLCLPGGVSEGFKGAMGKSKPTTMAELQAAQLWQIPLRVSFDALADLYYGADGPWVDELMNASLKELEFHDTAGASQMRSELRHFFEAYRRRLRRR